MGSITMADSKQRPDHVPEENEYHSIHWLVIVTYVAATAGVAMLIMNAG